MVLRDAVVDMVVKVGKKAWRCVSSYGGGN